MVDSREKDRPSYANVVELRTRQERQAKRLMKEKRPPAARLKGIALLRAKENPL